MAKDKYGMHTYVSTEDTGVKPSDLKGEQTASKNLPHKADGTRTRQRKLRAGGAANPRDEADGPVYAGDSDCGTPAGCHE